MWTWGVKLCQFGEVSGISKLLFVHKYFFLSGSVLWQGKDKGGGILFKGICISLSASQTGVRGLSK